MSLISSEALFRVSIAVLLFLWGGPSSALATQQESAAAPDTVETLKLPVPRTFDLAHVEPEHFAMALGKDPERIFVFVRDQVTYEVYEGYLRGPRGTLLAMAGNSVDQAALLGAMLEHAGQRVQYVRGELSETAAKTLVDSMWADRPRAEPAESEPTPEVEAALEALRTSVERDYRLIRDHLERAGHKPGPEAVTSLPSLVQETQDHYWVQWLKDGAWVDLDPSFGAASMGETFASAGPPFEAFAEDLFHRVEIRIRLEEYTGEARSERVILKYSTKAAELSGVDLVLAHVRENWKGPVRSLTGAFAATIEDTGRLKPVLILGHQKWIAGDPFRQTPPPTGGMPGAFSMLRGEGTRTPVPIATSESLEFDFIYPDGRTETVVRQLFDRLGKVTRASDEPLTSEEVRARTETNGALDVSEAIYDLWFTTGRVDAAQLNDITFASSGKKDKPTHLRDGLRNIAIGMGTTSDAFLGRLHMGGGVRALVYPDSPRLFIADAVKNGKMLKLTLDLRRDAARVLAFSFRPDHAFSARVVRGVVDGTLERVVVDFVTAETRSQGVGPTMSTSSLLERASAESVPIVLFDQEGPRSTAEIPGNALLRLREDLARGYLALGPGGPVTLGKEPRYAWYRIDRGSGETIAVTDEGLHANGTEWVIINDEAEKETIIIQTDYVGRGTDLVHHLEHGTFQWGSQQLGLLVHDILGSGEVVRIVGSLPPYLFL